MIHGNPCLSGQDKRQADSLFTRGVEMQKSFPAIWEKFNSVLNFLCSSTQSLAFVFHKVSFCNAKGQPSSCES